jgi:hypothetical protein
MKHRFRATISTLAVGASLLHFSHCMVNKGRLCGNMASFALLADSLYMCKLKMSFKATQAVILPAHLQHTSRPDLPAG